MGVQLGAVTAGPAECIDVLQPFLPGQRIRAPLRRERVSDPSELFSRLQQELGRLTVSMRL